MKQDKHDYHEVFYQPGEEPVFCYRSGLAVYEEKLRKGALISQGYNAAGYPLNVLTNCATRLDYRRFREPFAFNLEINGQCIDYDLRFVDFSENKSERDTHAILTLDSNIAPVRIKIHTILDGTQMFTRYYTIENLSETPLNISRMTLLGGGIEAMEMMSCTYDLDPKKYYSIGYFDNDHWGREGEFNWHDLMPETTTVDFRYLRERYRHPLIFLRNNVDGTIWFSQIAWSGGCRFSVDYKAVRENTLRSFSKPALAFKAEITGHNPLLVLRPNEIFTSPEVHRGVIKGDLDMAVNEMHAHVRKSVLNLSVTDPSECLIGCGMGAEHDMSVETSKAFIDQFAEMGGEIFIIDAGWQNPPHEEMKWIAYNGRNCPDADRYPNGISEIGDYCHKKGMKFGMWIEIERLGECSDVFKDRPEWRARNVYGEVWKENIFSLDFSNPEAAEWAENELARMITEYKLDLLRIDHNADQNDYFNMRDTTQTGMKECVAVRHFQAIYKMYENLKRRFPHIIFENCAGGGGRTDFGMMKAFNHTWVSDCQSMPHSAMITNGMTMALPPERVDRLFAGMGCHAFASVDAHMRNTMLGHMSLNVIAPAATKANSIQMEFVKHSLEIYKEFIRPMLPTCKIFHHTPEVYKTVEEGYQILEIASPDGGRGAITVITLSGSNEKAIRVCPKGVDAGIRYKVTLDNEQTVFEMDGRELQMEGIVISISASMSSELVLFEAV